MDAERLGYVEEFGLSFEGFGLPRMVGRVLGALMVSEAQELSAEEIAELLSASRGSISTATRSLVQMGLAQRFSKTGERRDYFRVKPGAWQGLMRREIDALGSFREMAERGLALMRDSDPEARRSLEEMRDLYAFWERELPALLERFEAEQEEKSWKR